MRLTLLLICFFSILGGCAASSSHGVVVPKLIRYSEKQQSSIQNSNNSYEVIGTNDETLAFSSYLVPLTSYIELSGYTTDDMDDDDDRETLLIKKNQIQANTAVAHAQLATLGRFYNYRLVAASLRSESPKYIVQRTFRV